VTALPSSFGIALALLCGIAAPAAAEQAGSIALSCPVCHGAVGSDAAHAPSAVPSFYGRSAEEIGWQLREFRAGSRQGSAMSRLANALTDDEIDALAHRYGVAP
jgi:cytochrome c553